MLVKYINVQYFTKYYWIPNHREGARVSGEEKSLSLPCSKKVIIFLSLMLSQKQVKNNRVSGKETLKYYFSCLDECVCLQCTYMHILCLYLYRTCT